MRLVLHTEIVLVPAAALEGRYLDPSLGDPAAAGTAV